MFASPGLALILAAVLWPSDGLPAHGEVVVGALNVHDAPDAASFRSGRLRRGATVRVRNASPDGWLAIDPPADTFEWIDDRAITIQAGDVDAGVVEPRAVVRSGLIGAKVPGPIIGERKKGDRVRLVDFPPLSVSGKGGRRVMRGILPAPGAVRYVRAEGVDPRPKAGTPPAEVRVAYQGPAADGDIRSELAHTEAMHRAVVRGPIEQWWLEPIKARYQALLPRASDSATAGLIRERLAVVARQEEMARDALTFDNVLQQSRLRDGSLSMVRRRLASVKRSERPSFDAEGVIQPSSRKIDGQKALALIGSDGFAVAYLSVPPGLDTRPLLTRRVGVRGAVNYDEHLRARVIAVSDLEPLERSR